MKEVQDLHDLTMHDFQTVYLQLEAASGFSLKSNDGKKLGKSTEES